MKQIFWAKNDKYDDKTAKLDVVLVIFIQKCHLFGTFLETTVRSRLLSQNDSTDCARIVTKFTNSDLEKSAFEISVKTDRI